MENYFRELNSINCSDKTEKKNGLTYLSWAWAWGEIKKLHPDATYTIYEDANGLFYHTDGKTCWVKTGVTVNGIEHIEYLPVLVAALRLPVLVAALRLPVLVGALRLPVLVAAL
jgi:hypothetical protein